MTDAPCDGGGLGRGFKDRRCLLKHTFHRSVFVLLLGGLQRRKSHRLPASSLLFQKVEFWAGAFDAVILSGGSSADGRSFEGLGAPSKVKRSRALRNETRQMVRSELMSDAVKWKNMKARSCFKNLRMGMSGVHSRGVFATEKIEPEIFIIEYTGELIRASVAEIREKRYENGGQDSSYLFR